MPRDIGDPKMTSPQTWNTRLKVSSSKLHSFSPGRTVQANTASRERNRKIGEQCLEMFWRNDRWHSLFPHALFNPAKN